MKTPKYQQIINNITEKINSAVLKPGDRLPTEKQLSEQYGVSRIVASNAMAKLVDKGLVERVQGRGSFVSEKHQNLYKKIRDDVNIAIVMPEISSPFNISLSHNLNEAAQKAGMRCAFYLTGNELDTEVDDVTFVTRAFENGRVYDGLLLFSCSRNVYNKHILDIVDKKVPTVLIDRYLPGIPLPCVQTDNVKAVRMATAELISLGHRKIAVCMASSGIVSSLAERTEGFIQEMCEQKIMIDPSMVIKELCEEKNQQKLIEMIKEGRATAVICLNSGTYSLVRKIVNKSGLKCPDDVSLMAIDKYGSPELFSNYAADTSCIIQDTQRIAAEGIAMLKKLMDNDAETCNNPQKILIAPSFSKGNTIGKPKSHD